VERALSQYFGVGAAFGLFQANNTINVPVSQGVTSTFASVDQTVRSAYLILNARLTVPAGAFEPYVEGGGGYYLTNIHESSSLGSRSKDDTSFGYHAGAGINWFFTKEYYIGLGGRYFWAETDDQSIRLDGVLADVNLGFRF
jgi:opacity protein-like surface antigen